MALPNLPGEHIKDAFNWLQDKCPVTDHPEALQALLRYFNKNWILNATIPPTTWSNYMRSVRTNNDVEGWHQRLNGSTPVAHPNLYFLVFMLQEETKELAVQIRMVIEHQVTRRVRRESCDKNERLFELWAMYDAKTITTSAFLRECGKLADHNERDP